MQKLSPGAIVDRKYKVEKLLGEGGMGVVWLCRDIVTDVPVVVKAIRSEFTHLKDYRERILSEGRALARIDHSNVVRLNAVVAEDDDVCLVMQFVEGESLDARVERNQTNGTQFSIPETVAIFRQIVSGVSAAHAEGIIHRDLKPANVLVRSKDGVIKVTDFGIAKEESEAQEGRGKTVGVIGSVRYMAPEQCVGRKDIDKRVDIYALGILLFELLTGTRPFDAESTFDLMSKHVHEPLPSVSARRPDVPQWLENIIRRCCEKQREHRFASCEELLAQIPADVEARFGATVPGAPPVMAQVSTVPAMPIAVQPPRVPMSSNATAPASAITARDNLAEAAPKRWPSMAATVVVSIVVGLGVSYSLGWFGPRRTNADATRASSQSVALAPALNAKHKLETLQGSWTSTTGRAYDAVLVGDVLEMRIHDVKPFAAQGYEQNEARLLLRASPGKPDTFVVEDRLRPNAPTGSEYDTARARATCLVPFTEVSGKPLEARLVDGKLYVDMVLIKPDTSHYTFEGKRVTGCRSLLTATLSRIESVLGRP